jgi:membrane protein
MPDTGMRMDEALEDFIAAAGRLTTIGIAGLIVTSVLLLVTIEGAFNRIFRVPHMRPILARLVVFWTVITIGPLLLGLSFSLSGYFVTIRRLLGEDEPGSLTVLLGTAMPTLVTAIAFALIYMAVPNRKVRIADALLGGVIAALLFAVLRFGFSAFVAGIPTYQAIYGAVAALPVFLIWLFLSWNVILAGAVIAAALPDWRRSEHERATGPGGRLALAMDILAALYAVAGTGAGLTQQALRRAVGVREAALIPVLDELMSGSFVSIGDDNVWRLGRDLSRTPVSDLVHLLGYGVPITPDLSGQSESVCRLSEVLAKAQANEKQNLGQPVSRLIEERSENVEQGPRAISG